jgi:hypothetical protein
MVKARQLGEDQMRSNERLCRFFSAEPQPALPSQGTLFVGRNRN